MGICDIPPGLRFIHFTTGHGLSQAFFFRSSIGGVSIKAWSAKEETLLPASGLGAEEEAQCLADFHAGKLRDKLGPYPREDLCRWEGVSCYITEALLRYCQLSVDMLICPGDLRPLEGVDEAQMVPFFEDQMRTAAFTFIPELAGTNVRVRRNLLKKRPHLEELLDDPRKKTAMAQDSSMLLEALLKVEYEGNEELFLGEIQLAFVLFMYIGSYEALEQWKRMLDLACNCGMLQATRPTMFAKFVDLLIKQLEFAPKDLFLEELFGDNFLIGALSRIVCDTCQERDAQLQGKINELEAFLRKRFGEKLLSAMKAIEEENDQPVIVQSINKGDAKSAQKDSENDADDNGLRVEGYTLVDTIPDPTPSKDGQGTLQRMEWMLPPNHTTP